MTVLVQTTPTAVERAQFENFPTSGSAVPFQHVVRQMWLKCFFNVHLWLKCTIVFIPYQWFLEHIILSIYILKKQNTSLLCTQRLKTSTDSTVTALNCRPSLCVMHTFCSFGLSNLISPGGRPLCRTVTCCCWLNIYCKHCVIVLKVKHAFL